MIGVRIKDVETIKTVTVQIAPEVIKALGFDDERNSHIFYLKKYLGLNVYDFVMDKFNAFAKKSIPEHLKKDCLYCTGQSTNKDDKSCNGYTAELHLNFAIAATTFVNIIEHNKHLISAPNQIKNLTLKFYQCFVLIDFRLAFDLRKITMHCLEEGFLTLGKVFSSNDALQNLAIINQAIDEISTEERKNKMFDTDIHETYHIKPQKEFFKAKRKYYKEEVFIETHSKNTRGTTTNILNQKWFKVGLEFAKGNIQKLLENENSFTAIAKTLGDPSYRPYISESMSLRPKYKDKAILKNPAKMKLIFDYCTTTKIPMHKDFIAKYEALQ